MNEIERIEKALNAWREYSRSFPELATWLEPDLEFVLVVARRIESNAATLLDEDERMRILELAGDPGPIGGFAVHDIADVDLGNLLCDAQQAIDKMARKIG
jgi:hypothetical protein